MEQETWIYESQIRMNQNIKNWRTFKEANSLRPISTDSILSIFPSPVKSLKSRLLLSESSPPAQPAERMLTRTHETFKNNSNIASNAMQEFTPFQDSSLAFCPAETTISKGRGAKDDQCSYLEAAISAHIPVGHRNMGQT